MNLAGRNLPQQVGAASSAGFNDTHSLQLPHGLSNCRAANGKSFGQLPLCRKSIAGDQF